MKLLKARQTLELKTSVRTSNSKGFHEKFTRRSDIRNYRKKSVLKFIFVWITAFKSAIFVHYNIVFVWSQKFPNYSYEL